MAAINVALNKYLGNMAGCRLSARRVNGENRKWLARNDNGEGGNGGFLAKIMSSYQ
jgi:hypothetical protein